jgi:hypothetical protein
MRWGSFSKLTACMQQPMQGAAQVFKQGLFASCRLLGLLSNSRCQVAKAEALLSGITNAIKYAVRPAEVLLHAMHKRSSCYQQAKLAVLRPRLETTMCHVPCVMRSAEDVHVDQGSCRRTPPV